MSNPLKYSTSTPTGALRHDTLGAGVASIQYDSTFNSGATPSILTSYYLIYEPVNGTAVRIYAPANAAELIKLAQSKGSSETTEAGALTWLSDNGYYPANKVLDNIVTDDLVLFIDSSTLTSYPGSGTDILDLSGTGADWTIPSDVFNSTTGVFNYASDQSSKSPPSAWQSTTDLTVEVLYKPNTGGIYTGCCDTIFGRYDFRFFQIGASLYAMIGFDDGNGTRVYQHPAYTVSYDRWHHVLAIRRDNRYIIWIDGVEKYNTTYGTGLSLWDPSETYYLSSTRHTSVDFAACRVYTKGLSDSEILQNYYQGPIVTNGLIRALDFSNLLSYQYNVPYNATGYDLTGNDTFDLFNAPTFTTNFGGGMICEETDEFIALDDVTATDYVSVECWYTKDSEGAGEDIVWNKESCWELNDNNGDLSWALMASNQSWFWYDTGVNIAIGETAHFVLTYDGNYVRFYKNGVLESTYTYPSGGVLANQTSCYPKLNSRNCTRTTVQNPGNHTFYQFRIYDRALTDAEVGQNYNANVKKYT